MIELSGKELGGSQMISNRKKMVSENWKHTTHIVIVQIKIKATLKKARKKKGS